MITSPQPAQAKPTPGPWHIIEGTLGSVEAADGTSIAQAQQVGKDDRYTNHAVRLANAALIASAPALAARVAVLESALGALRYAGPRGCFCEMSIGNPMVTSHTNSCRVARAALGEGGAR